MIYLTCDATMKADATVKVTLTGTALKAFSAASSMTVKPVAKATKLTGDAAKVGPTVLSTGGNAGSNSVDIKCPVVGTAWV
jgi:hypothetical protein